MEESPREIQENEFYALQAIFTDDCVLRRAIEIEDESTKDDDDDKDDETEEILEVAEKEGNKMRLPRLMISDVPLDENICFRVRLRPQRSMDGNEAHASVDLDVELPATYPACAPHFKLMSVKGVPKDDVVAKQKELKMLADKWVGQEIIYELVSNIQIWLNDFNHPLLSFYEQMVAEKQTKMKMEQEEHDRRTRQEAEEAQRRKAAESQHIQDELARQQKQLRKMRQDTDLPLEYSPRGGRKSVSISAAVKTVVYGETPTFDTMPAASPDCMPSILTTHFSPLPASSQSAISESSMKSKTIGNFDGVVITKTLGHSSSLGCKTSLAFNRHTEMICVCQWSLQCRSGKRSEMSARRLKQVFSIEQELQKWDALSHGNLVHYHGMRHWLDQDEPDTIQVEVIKEYISGGSLACHLNGMATNTFQGEMLYSCSQQLLSAVDYLHSHNIVHRDIQLNNIFLDHCGKIRLADYCISRRVGDLYRSLTSDEPAPQPIPPNPTCFDRIPSKKGDVFRMGLILLALSQGQVDMEYTGTFPTAATVSPSFKDFIDRCLEPDNRLRPSCRELLQHPYIMGKGHPMFKSMPSSLSLRNGLPSPPTMGSPGFLHDPLPSPFTNRSRLVTEFEFVDKLGRGGFGEVFKVLNKLDGCAYAIKRIKLEKRHEPFNSKIVREVKLLSRLNHENVVRYYNSWIETQPKDHDPWGLNSGQDGDNDSLSDIDDEEGEDDEDYDEDEISDALSQSSDSSNGRRYRSRRASRSSKEFSRDASSPELSGTSDTSAMRGGDVSEDIFEMSFGDEDDAGNNDRDVSNESDDAIIFGFSGGGKEEKTSSSEEDEDVHIEFADQDRMPDDPPLLRFLYIQMEYCERSTLRTLIDKQNLYKDQVRVWRLFRELVEGIGHIHDQGMIHRDLKPQNIFLDSNDHVKIGDFGLATTHTHSLRQNSFFVPTSGVMSPMSELSPNNSMTNRVGTAAYIAPELNKVPRYTQKVDIYSLGIIFFEMCHPAVSTGMERVKILSGLRSEEVVFPVSFDELALDSQKQLVRWMLKHNPRDRPTGKELLQSGHFPLPMEDTEMKEVLRQTLASSSSTRYHELMASLFTQPADHVVDHTYDIQLHNGMVTSLHRTDVRDRLTKIFRRHGAVMVSTPQLTPYTSSASPESTVCLMDRHGVLVMLRHDMRTSCARTVARNGIQNLKRFVIGKVYRDKKVRGAHPKEVYECAFDIVTPTPGVLLADAEVIFSVTEVIQEFPHLTQSASYTILLNHTSLVQALLRHCSVPQEHYSTVRTILNDISWQRTRWAAAQLKLTQLSLSELAVQNMHKFVYPMELEKVKEKGDLMRRDKGSTSIMVSEGLHELETVISHLHGLGVKTQIMIDFGVVNNSQIYSGIMFRVQLQAAKRQRRNVPLAEGGRYDKLITGLASPSQENPTASAVGVSISIDYILMSARECERDVASPSLCDVLVTSIGPMDLVGDCLLVVRDLWAAGISADVHPLGDVQALMQHCRNFGITYMVMLKDRQSESSQKAKVRIFEKDKTVVQDKLIAVSDLVETILSKRLIKDKDSSEGSGPSRLAHSVCESAIAAGGGGPTAPSQSASASNISVNLMTVDSGKLPTHLKRRYQASALAKVTPLVQKLGIRSALELLALTLPKQVLQDMRTTLDLSLEQDDFYERAVALRNQHTRYKKYLLRVCDHIQELVYEKKLPIVFLYSCNDEFCEVLF